MGRGGAQLGKSIKGKSKDRRKARHVGAGGAVDVNGVELAAADGQQSGSGDVAADLRALEEYERLAANSEMHRRRMNELARQERQYHTANAALLHRIYRQWRRKEKTDDMRAELEVLAANHTADVQRKNRCIDNMQRAIAAAHTQSVQRRTHRTAHATRPQHAANSATAAAHTCSLLGCCRPCRMCVAHRSHLGDLQRLHSLHQSHLASLESDFHAASHSAHSSFSSQQHSLRQQHAVAVSELQLLVGAVEADEVERVNEGKQSFETEREEIRNKNLEAINELRITLENRIEELERTFDELHRYYRDMTEHANAHFVQLKHDDATLSLDIDDKKKRMAKLHSHSQQLRKKHALNDREARDKYAQLIRHKQHMQALCKQMEERIKAGRKQQKARVAQLAQHAHSTIQHCKDRLGRAERILRLMTRARGKETEKEKVMPLQRHRPHTAIRRQLQQQKETEEKTQSHIEADDGRRDWSAESQSSTAAAAMNSGTGSGSGSASESGWSASLLIHKHNKVSLDVLAIRHERQRLVDDNARLKAQLETFLNGIAITHNTMDRRDNTLLIVNPFSRQAHSVAAAGGGSGNIHTLQSTLVATVSARQPLIQEATVIVQQVTMHRATHR